MASRTTIGSPGFTVCPTFASILHTFPGTEAFTSMEPAGAAAVGAAGAGAAFGAALGAAFGAAAGAAPLPAPSSTVRVVNL